MAVFLTPDEIAEWRVLSYVEGWQITKPWGEKFRTLLARLDPPFMPEAEALVFDAPIGGGTAIRITEIIYQGRSVGQGFLIATESRLIYGDKKAIAAAQIPYESLKAVYAENNAYTLVLTDGSQLIVRAKAPGPSLVAAVALIGGDPHDKPHIAQMEREKARVAQDFANAFAGFFTAIVDENRRRRGGAGSEQYVATAAGTATSNVASTTVHGRPAPAVTATVDPNAPLPAYAKKPWYRSFGFLLLLFLFATPLWAILIITDEDQSIGVKALAGGFLVVWVILLLSVRR
jgi:hypothetical protein